MTSDYSVSIASKHIKTILAFFLAACLCLAGPGTAVAFGDVFYDKGDAFRYGGGTTRPMSIDGRWAYCAFPPTYSPEPGFYEKVPLSTMSGRNEELAAVLWFGWGSPGFDPSVWPSTWYDGGGMDDLRYAALTHVLVTEVFWSDTDIALHECFQPFRDWAMWELFGYGADGSVANDRATGRIVEQRMSEVPNGFSAFMINVGTDTQVVVSYEYEPVVEPEIELSTVAVDSSDGDKYVQAGDVASIVDTVFYEGLKAGVEYELTGTLMVRSSGEALIDPAGRELRVSQRFVPEEASGSVDMLFSFDSSLAAGQDVVVFESLSVDGEEVASHEDIDDEGQTIHVVDLSTFAQDLADGDKYLEGAQAVVIDTVSYAGLVPGATYRLCGTLVDAATGRQVATGTSDDGEGLLFTPDDSEGVAKLTFSFDANECQGQRLVVLEKLFDGDTLVASHEDVADLGQSVYVVEIGTTLTDASDGDHVVEGESISLVDMVEYHGLIAGEAYTMRGVLVQAQTGEPLLNGKGEAFTSEVSFVAQEPDGYIEVPFDLSSLQAPDGTAIVAFEECIDTTGKVIASHKDLSDQNQTVVFVKKPPVVVETVIPKTGDFLVCMIAPLGALALICGVAVAARARKRFGELSSR